MTENRQPTGTPAGGQFAATAHTEPGVVLTSPAVPTDDNVMDRIALMLGTVEEWDGSADYLEEIADLIGHTGRPHPGNVESHVYRRLLAEHASLQATAPSATTKALDAMARELGTTDDWSADELDEVTNRVIQSGRPSCGGGIEPDDYLVRIVEGKAERAPSYEEATEILVEGLGTYLAEFADEAPTVMLSWGFTPQQDETGAWSYSTEIEVRGEQEDATVDVAGTPAERLLDDLARNALTRGALAPVTG